MIWKTGINKIIPELSRAFYVIRSVHFLNDISTFKIVTHSFTQWWSMVLSSGATHHWVRKFSKTTHTHIHIYIYTHEVCPKSNENDLNFFLLNKYAITVYPLQNRLLMIEYSDSSVAATLHSSGGSLHLRCCSKLSSQLPGCFQLSQNWCPLRWVLAWRIKRNRTKPRQGCTVGGDALWYYFEPKIPIHHTNSSGTVSHKFFSCADLP